MIGAQWNYFQSNDEMTKGKQYVAFVQSTNSVDFGFPYSGAQRATLSLRTHPRYGKDVVLRMERGQFLCRSYEDCDVLVRFDDDSPEQYSGVGPADNSTETVFIRNYSRFVSAMLKARRVRISVAVYQQGSPVFDFDVRGFNQSKYRPPS